MEKKLSKKALNKSFHNWYYGHLTCFSQEHMQTFGYLCAMLPLVEELYDNEDDKAKAMNTYTAFFNTEPQLGSVIVGITAGLEEARASGQDDVDEETINGLRAGLMGPIAGIGDSLVVGTVIPILLGIAMGMSTGGSPLGAIFYIIVWNLFAYFGMRFMYSGRYRHRRGISDLGKRTDVAGTDKQRDRGGICGPSGSAGCGIPGTSDHTVHCLLLVPYGEEENVSDQGHAPSRSHCVCRRNRRIL